jgi:hypothetical protein
MMPLFCFSKADWLEVEHSDIRINFRFSDTKPPTANFQLPHRLRKLSKTPRMCEYYNLFLRLYNSYASKRAHLWD